ncbi:MAG: thioredoxin [Candidatus Muiribacterium halophilum]|uniref:Thioredoxin n=1 Tax=Muiribacterium halophilum TaxID=2053465 RepID=A0A2N5ZKY9_MUIH1|nr:MAG: thioredoxin [Candidatus Muirbacterium halophilum]
MAKVLNKSDFENLVKNKETMVIDFYADWCGPCKMLTPIVEELATEYEGKVGVYKVDVDQTPELAQMFGVTGIPTVVFFKDGEKAETHVGFLDKDSFKTKIDNL